ncbi:hypothetical protein TNCV_3027071 [Trichonephila clavipes]|nr:hypothetical protein TNCV_3027071 [Trichonephila clavipes]
MRRRCRNLDACYAEDCGFQMLNVDEIVTSVQGESDSVGNEMDEDEVINNKSSRDPSNADPFSALETAMEGYEQHQSAVLLNYYCSRESDLAAKK